MTSDKNSVDLEKLSNSLKVVENATNNLNNMSISNIVLDIDNDLTKINFEHGNCFKDYKELIDSLVTQIDDLKVDTNELTKGLEKTINSFSEIEKDTSFRKIDLSNNMENALEGSTVTRIPAASTEQTSETEVQTKDPINTIPIGLGIAASGIAGSVGAVVVDSMMPTEKKDPIPDYEENVAVVEKAKKKENEYDEFVASEHKFDDVTPYHASRDRETIDKFYDGNDN